MKTSRAMWALIVVTVTGCGGAAQPSPATAAKPSTDVAPMEKGREAASSDKPATAAEDTKKPSADKPSPQGKPIGEHEKDFMSGCAKSPDFKPYCDCAWGVFASVITKTEMDTNQVSDAKLTQVEKKTGEVCVDKIPESMVKEGFMKGCSKDNPGFQAYCECYWPEMRKRFSIGEIANKETVKSEKFAAAGKDIARKCAGKLPESVVKDGFMKGCTGGNAPAEKFCQCAWKELKTVMNYAEIDMAAAQSTPEFKKAQEKIEKSCSKLRPGR